MCICCRWGSCTYEENQDYCVHITDGVFSDQSSEGETYWKQAGPVQEAVLPSYLVNVKLNLEPLKSDSHVTVPTSLSR